MTSFETIYDQFLSTVSIKFNNLTDTEIKQELFNWTVLASSRFKFPRIPLDFEVFDETNQGPDGEVGPYFTSTLTQAEITVIIEYMKLTHYDIQLADSEKYDMYYEDANLKLPSQTAMLTQLNRTYENQRAVARKTENDYYRTHNNQPTIGEIWMP